jgi:hypothetical protein
MSLTFDLYSVTCYEFKPHSHRLRLVKFNVRKLFLNNGRSCFWGVLQFKFFRRYLIIINNSPIPFVGRLKLLLFIQKCLLLHEGCLTLILTKIRVRIWYFYSSLIWREVLLVVNLTTCFDSFPRRWRLWILHWLVVFFRGLSCIRFVFMLEHRLWNW